MACDVISKIIIMKYIYNFAYSSRDPPEPTGDEPDDFEFEAPKIYEPVSM